LSIQSEDSRVKILVIPTDEEREIARQTIQAIRRARSADENPIEYAP
jgi:acetate kinase